MKKLGTVVLVIAGLVGLGACTVSSTDSASNDPGTDNVTPSNPGDKADDLDGEGKDGSNVASRIGKACGEKYAG